MNIERDRWYAVDTEDGDGRQTVYVTNILQSFTTYDADTSAGEGDGVFIKLTDEVDGYGPMPPFWSCSLEDFIDRNPEPTDAPDNGRVA